MTLEQIKRINIRAYLAGRGIVPKTENTHGGMYLSPLRKETTPSFKVDYDRNLWFDHGIGEGGSIIDLVMRMERCTLAEAIEKLEGNDGALVAPMRRSAAQPTAIEITDVRPFENPALLQYLSGRAIDPTIAAAYCKEVHCRINGKPYFAIGFQNDAGGWELRNAWFKGSRSPKNITTICNDSDTCMVFEGFMDFLSYLTLKSNAHPRIDTCVLNSVANLKKAITFLEMHRTIHAFLDNDAAGSKSLVSLRESLPGSEVVDQSAFYRDHKDLNDYWREKSKPENRTEQAEAAVQVKRQIPVVKQGRGPKLQESAKCIARRQFVATTATKLRLPARAACAGGMMMIALLSLI